MTDAAFLIGRICLAAIFLISGWDKLSGDLDGFSAMIGGMGVPEPALIGPFAAGVETAAASLLIVGLMTRPAALALVLFTVVATVLVHLYWTYPPEAQQAQSTQFWKNVGLIGGLLVVAGAGPGRIALDRLFGRSRSHRTQAQDDAQ